ncbi:MAG: amidase [Gammaproteobacteria bacterium]
MTADDLAYLDLTALSQAIGRREFSALEVTRNLLARIAQHDGALGAYVCVLADGAEREAKAADSALARGQALGPLHGVPVAVKDLCDAGGTRTLAGMPTVRASAPPATRDATVVARLRAAGAVLVGKLQLTEGAVAHHHPEVTPPRNPHHAEYWSGASSSGSGVAAAAGLAYGTLGSDTGGSIRFPSFANGVTGLKPTWGRVSRAGVFPLAWSLDHIGPIARSAADCAALLAAIAGYDEADPTTLAAPVPDYPSALGGNLTGLRVGFDADYATSNVDSDICAALEHALDVFRAAGASIVAVRFPETADVIASWFPLCTAEAAAAHAATYPAQATLYGPELRELLDGGNATSGRDYALAHDLRQNFRGRVARVFGACDVLLAPAWMRQNLTLAEFAVFGTRESDWPELVRFTAPFDIAGTPTLSLPAGFTPAGAPFGFQLVAPHLGETALLRAGHAYQQATDWHRRRPALTP